MTPPWHRTHSVAPSPTHVWLSTRMQMKSDLAVHPDFCATTRFAELLLGVVLMHKGWGTHQTLERLHAKCTSGDRAAKRSTYRLLASTRLALDQGRPAAAHPFTGAWGGGKNSPTFARGGGKIISRGPRPP